MTPQRAGEEIKSMAEYPDETEGSRIAAEIRAECNKLTPEEREALFRQGMEKIYGGRPDSTQAPDALARIKETAATLPSLLWPQGHAGNGRDGIYRTLLDQAIAEGERLRSLLEASLRESIERGEGLTKARLELEAERVSHEETRVLMHRACRGEVDSVLRRELDGLKAALADPATVWANMLRGTIAMPIGVRDAEKLKCEMEVQRDAARRELKELRGKCREWEEGLSDGNDVRVLRELAAEAKKGEG